MVLVPIEHLSARGMSATLARLAQEVAGWPAEWIACFDAGFARYWERSTHLARRTTTWPPPRRRHVVVVRDPLAVRPYVGLLNTSAWLLYESDLAPETSDPEFLAYLLVHGDWVVLTGEVSLVAARSAAWWLQRSDAECAAFAAAAARTPRPDAPAWRAIAAALPWLRQLHHDTLNPPLLAIPERRIPGTGLLVPRPLEHEPARLAEVCGRAAQAAVAAYHSRWRRRAPRAVATLCDWLAGDRPPLLVAGAGDTILWDPEQPDNVGPLAKRLQEADAVAVAAIQDDLGVIAARTRAFLDAVVEPEDLSCVTADFAQNGYAYLHRTRRLIAYNLDEPGMERLQGPPLPYARSMLGARTAHEWGHLADSAGWVLRTVSDAEHEALCAALAAELDGIIAAAPAAVRRLTAADLAALAGEASSAGRALVALLLTRIPDWRTNLVARAFMHPEERETYARHNIRSLRDAYAAPHLWRMLVRYLYEYQYLCPPLALSQVPDPRDFFVGSTYFTNDFFETGVLTVEQFDRLAVATGRICACHRVDATRLKLPPPPAS